MRTFFAFIISTAVALLTACASTIPLDSLSKPTNPGDTIIVKGFRYNQPENDGVSIGLTAGVYKVEHENAEGHFYRGPGLCVKIPAVINSNRVNYPDHLLPGGLFVSKSEGSREYRIYYYQLNLPASNTQPNQTETQSIAQNSVPKAGILPSAAGTAIGMSIVNAIIESGRGQIALIPSTSTIQVSAFVHRP